MARETAAVRLLAGDKEPVRLASTANLSLSGLLTVDGVVTVAGDRVLVKNQTDATANGVYTASAGTWKRAPDAASSRTIRKGMMVYVQEGSTLAGNTWVFDTDEPNIGTDNISFSVYLTTNIISTATASASAAAASAATATTQAGIATAAAASIVGTAFPPAGLFKSLVIKTLTATTLSASADFVVVTDGTNYKTVALNAVLNISLNGLVNRLDTGTVAANTWYSIWAIATSAGASGLLVSTSATAPTMPAGYTYKARIGWTKTLSASSSLHGIYQYGRRAQYIVGLVSTTSLPGMVNQAGAIGSVSVPTYVAQSVVNVVPTTASIIYLTASVNSSTTSATVLIAPNASYGAYNSTSNMPPITSVTDTTSNQTLVHGFAASLMLETTNIYVAATGSTNLFIGCLGWEDNI